MFGNIGSKIISQLYKRVIIFCVASSSNISLHHQGSFTSEETIVSKLNFERVSMGAVVPLDIYSKNNGIYTPKYFTINLYDHGQVIRHSVVVGHHNNGLA